MSSCAKFGPWRSFPAITRWPTASEPPLLAGQGRRVVIRLSSRFATTRMIGTAHHLKTIPPSKLPDEPPHPCRSVLRRWPAPAPSSLLRSHSFRADRILPRGYIAVWLRSSLTFARGRFATLPPRHARRHLTYASLCKWSRGLHKLFRSAQLNHQIAVLRPAPTEGLTRRRTGRLPGRAESLALQSAGQHHLDSVRALNSRRRAKPVAQPLRHAQPSDG